MSYSVVESTFGEIVFKFDTFTESLTEDGDKKRTVLKIERQTDNFTSFLKDECPIKISDYLTIEISESPRIHPYNIYLPNYPVILDKPINMSWCSDLHYLEDLKYMASLLQKRYNDWRNNRDLTISKVSLKFAELNKIMADINNYKESIVPKAKQECFEVVMASGDTKDIYYDWVDNLSIVDLYPFEKIAKGNDKTGYSLVTAIAYDKEEHLLFISSSKHNNTIGYIRCEPCSIFNQFMPGGDIFLKLRKEKIEYPEPRTIFVPERNKKSGNNYTQKYGITNTELLNVDLECQLKIEAIKRDCEYFRRRIHENKLCEIITLTDIKFNCVRDLKLVGIQKPFDLIANKEKDIFVTFGYDRESQKLYAARTDGMSIEIKDIQPKDICEQGFFKVKEIQIEFPKKETIFVIEQ